MNGQRNPTVAVLRKMAGYFTMPMDELHARLEKTKTAPDGWLG